MPHASAFFLYSAPAMKEEWEVREDEQFIQSKKEAG